MPLEQMRLEKAGFLEADDSDRSVWAALRGPHSEHQRQTRQYVLLAVNVTILILSLLVNIWTWARVEPKCIRETDMQDAHSAIQYEQRVFTGALVYDPETKRAIRKQDAEHEYFGPPSEELDAAWHKLLHGEFPVMRPEEAAQFEPELTRIPKTKEFHFEPDMFHTLHCLNAVRLEASKSLYNISGGHSHGSVPGISLPEGWDLAHMEHCMDRIRQSIMCHGDLTPSPLYYWPGFKIALGRTAAHTCRRWQPMRDWMDKRGSEGPLLDPL
ncbi:hypothetical protein M409DRAFT_29764 [Zasmidium cellare ATCC 36951]|uniref:Tat pathway signal sequence n=1 Tax=Zasmidium cellare ATCC 36951 TaxID=1080233 RepID=A0A6A6C0S8_ZASCE|nr:uncharacterized protein M409DRAFT_29764 [Zasmidium cellare ATCC 36951]KAF2159760.1 hypothetical protein M409DRAFT_29764 [Zasmidium cellare ATCC 36951]